LIKELIDKIIPENIIKSICVGESICLDNAIRRLIKPFKGNPYILTEFASILNTKLLKESTTLEDLEKIEISIPSKFKRKFLDSKELVIKEVSRNHLNENSKTESKIDPENFVLTYKKLVPKARRIHSTNK